MAHELDKSNNRVNMAYVGATPWHGLGQELDSSADIEQWKVAAGMNWRVAESPLIFNGVDGSAGHVFPDRRVLLRSDNNAPLGVVSGSYRIVHPGEALEFFRDLVADNGFQLETAGCLFGGRKYWALARVGKTERIMGQDAIAPYLLLATACDGSMATCVDLTSVRVVCNNTLRMAIGADGAKSKIKVPHSATFDPSAVKIELGLVKDSWESFLDNCQTLASFSLSRDEAIQLVADELKLQTTTDEGVELGSDDILSSSLSLRKIIQLFDGAGMGADLRSSRNTAWGLLNAVTEWADHWSGAKNADDKSRAFERAHLTDRANLKTSFANRLLEVAA